MITVKMAIRMKMVLAFSLLVIAIAIGLASIAGNDDSANDKVRQIPQQTTSQTNEAEKTTTTSIESSKRAELPASCEGVNSMDVDLYPTGKECLSELQAKIMLNCGFDEKCVSEFDKRLYNLCGNDKVCAMSTLQSIYQQLGKQ